MLLRTENVQHICRRTVTNVTLLGKRRFKGLNRNIIYRVDGYNIRYCILGGFKAHSY